MSRSGYSDECDTAELNLWRGAVESALRGKRGQALLADLVAGLDAMPVKRLVSNELVTADGEFCSLGVVACQRNIIHEIKTLDPEDCAEVAKTFGIARALAAEVVFMNDEYFSSETPETKWSRMRDWAVSKLKEKP